MNQKLKQIKKKLNQALQQNQKIDQAEKIIIKEKAVKIPEIPKEIRVSNLDEIKIPEIKIPEYPKEVKVSNLKEIPKPEIKVEKVEFPDGIKEFKPKEFLFSLFDFLKKQALEIKNVFIKNRKPDEYIPVRVVYNEGGNLRFDPVYGGGSGGGSGLVPDDIEIGAVEIKNATDDTRAVVKSDGVDNALVVVQNTVPITTVQATDLDIRNLSSTSDSVTAEISNVVHVDDNDSTLSVDDGGGSLTVDGTVAVSSSALPTGAATEATLAKQLATTITEYNIHLTNANTEYSQTLPSNTKAFEFQCRQNHDIRFAFTAGKVAGPTSPYFTLKAGRTYYKENLDLSNKTIYFASETAGDDIELLVYS